jgi:adenylyltransferase/sulfurtransferase
MKDIGRYSRQARFAGVGEAGQRLLSEARGAVVGCGALGSLQAELLARAGVGSLTLIDRDFVELSNLQRQFLYDESDAADALPKAIAAARRLAEINSEIVIEPFVSDLTASNVDDLLGGASLILDGTDNFETRYLINDFAVKRRVPWIYGGAVGSYGITMSVVPDRSACFRCLYPEPPGGVQPTCETAGVLGPLTATIAALQTAAALRILCNQQVSDRITTVDVWSGEIRQSGMPERDPACPCCGKREFGHLDTRRRAPVSLCGRNAVQIHERERPLNLHALASQLAGTATVRQNDFALRATFPDYEMTVFPDGRAIIKGTTDVGLARSLYARYIGA